MTQMIYRPQTSETLTKSNQVIQKAQYRGVPCDALTVAPEHVPDYTSKGWFADPNQMIDEPNPRRGKKANDRSDKDSQ